MSDEDSNVNTELFKNIERLRQLRIEHRDLDDVITRLSMDFNVDEIQMKRLKKRKLLLKDHGYRKWKGTPVSVAPSSSRENPPARSGVLEDLAKPEGLALIEETSQHWDILVVFDGLKDGHATRLRVDKN